MSSIEKSNISNLEDMNDFGDSELNKVFKELDEKTQNDILKYTKKEVQIEILKSINDPELKKLYDNLSSKSKSKVDSVGIRDKYMLLRDLLKKKKAPEKSIITPGPPPALYEPKSPDNPPKIGIIVPFRDSDKIFFAHFNRPPLY